MNTPPAASADDRIQPGALIRFADAYCFCVIATTQRDEPNGEDSPPRTVMVMRNDRSGSIIVQSFSEWWFCYAQVDPPPGGLETIKGGTE